MRNKFEMQLDKLANLLIQMGEMCEKAIGDATTALLMGDLELARVVRDSDDEIDAMERKIESLCLKLLLQQQPVAKDLRQISAALKMITDMERIGDQAADISEIIVTEEMAEAMDVEDIREMSKVVSNMVRDSIMAYVSKDLALARRIIEQDDEVDALFEKSKEDVVTFIANNHGALGKKAIDLLMVAKYLERLGDHATNIAEWVEFSITGEHRAGQHET